MEGVKPYTKMAFAMAFILMPLLLAVSAQGPAPSPKLSASPSSNADADADPDAPPCWSKIMDCWEQSFNKTLVLDVTNPGFNLGEALCCPVLKEQVDKQLDCFCSIAPFLPEDPRVAPNLDIVLPACNVSSSFESICEGNSAAANVGPTITSLVFVLAGTLMFF